MMGRPAQRGSGIARIGPWIGLCAALVLSAGCGPGVDTSAESTRTADCWGGTAGPGAPDSCAEWLSPRAGVLGLSREPLHDLLAAGACGPPQGCAAPAVGTGEREIPTTGATPAPAEGWEPAPDAK